MTLFSGILWVLFFIISKVFFKVEIVGRIYGKKIGDCNILLQSIEYRCSQYQKSTLLHKYEVQLSLATILEHNRCPFEIKSASFLYIVTSKYVKKCDSEMHLKGFENIENDSCYQYLNLQQRKYIVNFSQAFLMSSTQCILT